MFDNTYLYSGGPSHRFLIVAKKTCTENYFKQH